MAITVRRPMQSARADHAGALSHLAQGFGLEWLPAIDDVSGSLRLVRGERDAGRRFAGLLALAQTRLDFLQSGLLDRELTRSISEEPSAAPEHLARTRIALLSSSTVDHLLPSIRVAGLRRGLLLDCTTGAYGMVRQEVLDPADTTIANSDFVLIAFDAASILPRTDPADRGGARASVERAVAELTQLWRVARERSGGTVIQQLVLDRTPALFGHLDAVTAGAPSWMIRALNGAIREAAQDERVLVFDLEALAARFGARRLFDPTRWHQAKQEIAPPQAPLYADHLARILMAARGHARKCLVLDLDNTLWGGVIGDDGLEGIRLGQGTPEGEAYAAFQSYVKQLAGRGIVLAASSKNDPAIALEAFERHPEMVLKREDISVFEANWGDKPAALQRIARKLEFGLDALVFFDDNPAERALVRDTLPEVAVPEVPPAAEGYVECLSDSGWFEAAAFTQEDVLRTRHYAADQSRRAEMEKAADIEAFLDSLGMELEIRRLDSVALQRATQLVNKTNQFNLTTRRTNEAEMAAFAADPAMVVLTGRASDKFGDSGLITVAAGRLLGGPGDPVLDIETWVMSCRVLGRRIEHAMRDALAQFARQAGANALLGHYRPTARNGLVRNHYAELGFNLVSEGEGGATDWRLDLRTDLPAWRSPFLALRVDV
ncbi:MAG: enzyme involved in methoxymalonyl-ACP biosynthesis [Rhodospirillales bacterium]|nr:enzyme involved in methoxymalonyl-ACP biosynthesis [Rhodospirillales bacterium]